MSAQNDAAFLRVFLVVLGALVAFTVIILFAARMITGVVEDSRGEDPRQLAARVERIKPIGKVNVVGAPVEVVAPAAAPQSGAEIVAAVCNACHVAGVLGAPKIGDVAAWEARLAAEGGLDGLAASAIKGKGGMPPKGGATASDDEIRAAVEHMVKESGIVTGTAAAAEQPVDVEQPAVTAVAPAAAPAAPVAAPPEPTDTAPDLAKGKSIYDTVCFACHATGAAGAPRLTDKAAWAPRIALGMEALVASVLNGKGAMPPKGGRLDVSDSDVKLAAAYMVSEAK